MFESFSSRLSSEIFLGEEKHSVNFYSELYFFFHNTPLNKTIEKFIFAKSLMSHVKIIAYGYNCLRKVCQKKLYPFKAKRILFLRYFHKLRALKDAPLNDTMACCQIYPIEKCLRVSNFINKLIPSCAIECFPENVSELRQNNCNLYGSSWSASRGFLKPQISVSHCKM